MTQPQHYDVAIIGGGPAGSTAACILRKYDSDLNVVIVEREQFPRDHVGESQLPPIGAILDEMGCWEKIEAANFPVKVGATYRWGRVGDLWDFDFVPPEEYVHADRPAPYEGLRKRTALQVDRARYDQILLEHARSLGSQVLQPVAVTEVAQQDQQIQKLGLSNGSTLTADWYIDASGHKGILRRDLDIDVHYPSSLKNIAIWDYWENARWAAEIGVGGTRVQVLSQSHGWIWFIPLGPTRTSIGLITPVEHYKQSGLSTEQIYLNSVEQDPLVSELIEGATQRGVIETTTDWSFLSDKTCGKNWFLVGESAGFADPILAAGMTLAHSSARECAYSILAIRRKEFDRQWIQDSYDRNQRERIRQHIRFADFWYAANGQFSDLQEHCQTIARESGLELSAEQAWQWIAQGGFTSDVPGQAVVAGFFNLASAKRCTEMFTDGEIAWNCDDKNVFRLNLGDAEEDKMPVYRDGRIHANRCFRRDAKRLPVTGLNELLLAAVDQTPYIDEILGLIVGHFSKSISDPAARNNAVNQAIQSLEALVSAGWILAEFDPQRAKLSIGNAQNSRYIKLRT